jgi:hypothetical protein
MKRDMSRSTVYYLKHEPVLLKMQDWLKYPGLNIHLK